MKIVLPAVAFLLLSVSSFAQTQTYTLELHPQQDSTPMDTPATARPDQLPHSTLSRGHGSIDSAWLAGPTGRYAHGVLGDGLEASRLVVRLRSQAEHVLELPGHRVFEDLRARLVDLDGDGDQEILVVESDGQRGASLAVYGVSQERITLRSRSPFIGLAHRWLNPLGAGDFDGDGHLDLALVRTPHIGGVLEIYQFKEPRLSLMAAGSGFSTHSMGSTELGLGAVVVDSPRDLILLPDQARTTLILVGIRGEALVQLAQAPLPGRITSSLRSLGQRDYAFEVEDGRAFRIKIRSRRGFRS